MKAILLRSLPVLAFAVPMFVIPILATILRSATKNPHEVNASWECREGVVIVTLTPACADAAATSLARGEIGISSVDDVIRPLGVSKVERFAPVGAEPTSDGGRYLFRTFLIWYESETNPHDVVSTLSSIPCVERVLRFGRPHD